MVITRQLERILGLVALALLAIGCLTVVGPLVTALVLAAILCCAAWPLYTRMVDLLAGHRTLAASLMTTLLAMILIAPFVIVIINLNDSVDSLVAALRYLEASPPPQPPQWLTQVPLFGPELVDTWYRLAADSTALMAEVRALAEPAMRWLLSTTLILGKGVLYLCLSVFVAFFFFRDGVVVLARLDVGMKRIGGERARHLLGLVNATIRGVVYGVLGAVLAQGILAGFGYWLAGVPGALVLGLLTIFMSFIPFGSFVLWIPAGLWLFEQDATGWAIFVFIWNLMIVSNIDSIIRPYLISQGSDLPFILVFLGVLGGILSFGFIGVFLGPTLLAVGYNLIREWTLIEPPAAES